MSFNVHFRTKLNGGTESKGQSILNNSFNK